jgi:hypothetical protein
MDNVKDCDRYSIVTISAYIWGRLRGLVVGVPGYRWSGPGFDSAELPYFLRSEWVWNGARSVCWG